LDIRQNSLLDRTKGELFGVSRNWQSARSAIQEHARKVFLASGLLLACGVCAYNKHVEVSHRKAVSQFPDTARVVEINSIHNLIALCPNHHWEYDNGLLTL
jgi:predicted restriction endonuclease